MPWVLVVDDDEPTRESLRLMLDDAGFAIAEAPDGQAALEMLRSTPFHAVVLFDLLMPVLDGVHFLEEVARDLRIAGRHAFILMSANENLVKSIAPELLTSLHVAVFRKPFDVDTMLNAVQTAASSLPPDGK